jgi:hypothetical protein
MREINDPDKGLCPEFNANIIKIKDNAYVWMLTFEKKQLLKHWKVQMSNTLMLTLEKQWPRLMFSPSV